MYRLIFSLFILLIIYVGESLAVETHITFTHKEMNDIFTMLLTERKIAHRVDEDGQIYYDIMDTEAIKKASIDAAMIDIPSALSISYSEPVVHQVYVNELKKAKVPYVVKLRHEEKWVVWSDGYKNEVSAAQKKAELKFDEIVQEKMKGFYKKSSNK